MKTVQLLSGGIDSTTLLYHLIDGGDDVYPLVVDYGQRHRKEIKAAIAIAEEVGVDDVIKVVDVSSINPLLDSVLTKKGAKIPEGHYAAESMKATVVPNRNAIMLNIAAGYALSIKANRLAYAAHAGDHFIYPDCRPEFVDAIQKCIQIGNETKMQVYAPFLNMTKSDIVRLGLRLDVSYELTWSCYVGEEKACGKCGTCVERLEAFKDNDAKDPIEYEGAQNAEEE